MWRWWPTKKAISLKTAAVKAVSRSTCCRRPVFVCARLKCIQSIIKFMVIDGESVETGSFNFTTSAARYNSENAVVMWHVLVVAQAYQQHWQSRFNQGRPWSGQASN
ncbi:phospholipase D-like domain-containing protein [Paraburkholderia sp. JPY465]|uniref:phospholipase D-like domain-containing protein n=1 Tax=Paraburkholderia sp. JPY465 TaxID=3042285 RepID=UPI003D1B4D8B